MSALDVTEVLETFPNSEPQAYANCIAPCVLSATGKSCYMLHTPVDRHPMQLFTLPIL